MHWDTYAQKEAEALPWIKKEEKVSILPEKREEKKWNELYWEQKWPISENKTPKLKFRKEHGSGDLPIAEATGQSTLYSSLGYRQDEYLVVSHFFLGNKPIHKFYQNT